ncbi:MAG TPA: hypothetical protein H9746_09720 [Candidatus Butyricicoccus avistercoris]|uniref:Uncharacterized protein n=1 Tax=Candidatus Butyricicoccus avistercoris TaxID=2838518 RepID=A0A9D1PK25_9FIRM|nr:hypothetical protein [Candidatus Butyricicoccus avistercoris]
MERINKQKNFCKAVERLNEALAEYDKSPSDTMRDGVIYRFKFEPSWHGKRVKYNAV